MNKTYHAKLLLFGEYSIVLGGNALAVPFKHSGGRFVANHQAVNGKDNASNRELKSLLNYLQIKETGQYLDLDRFQADLDDGLYFNSNIPVGYGLGSSGAVCAAVADNYGMPTLPNDLLELKRLFSLMESYFHGKSSGVDPLVTYLNHPVLILPDKIELVTLQKQKIAEQIVPFLVDTNTTSKTAPLVEHFLQSMKGEAYSRRIRNEYLPLSQKLIEGFIFGQDHLFTQLERLSVFQLDYFRDMIPNDVVEIWRYGLLNRKYALKLCGSGGGGYLLGFSSLSSQAIETLFGGVFDRKVHILHELY